MSISCQAWVALFLTLSSKAVASTNHKRDFCNNQTVNIASGCWDELGITQYLDHWWSQNKADCTSDPYNGDGFASCYQQKLKVLNYPCNNISVQDCYHPNFNENANINVTEYYVLYSIYGIWAWYNSLWQAAVAFTLLADLSAGEIVDAIKSDMPKDTPLPGDTSLGVLLSLLPAGLAFVDFPAGGVSLKVFSTAAQQAPGLAKALLTTGSLGSQVTPLDEIEASLGSIMQQFQLNLANALNVTQMDYDIFIAHAANGSFIANTPSLNASTAGLTQYMKTFIVAQALQSHNIIVTVADRFDIYGFSHKEFTQPENGTMLPQNSWHVNCQDKPDVHGVCDNWWVDSRFNSSYALFKLDDMEHNFYGLMQTLFGNGWTTGKELFLGSRECAIASYTPIDTSCPTPATCYVEMDNPRTVGVRLPMFPRTGTDEFIFNVSNCFSNLRLCAWNQTNNLTTQDDSEFSNDIKGGGCTFAWPNTCIYGKGLVVQDPIYYPDHDNSIYYQNLRAGVGIAYVTQMTTGHGLNPNASINQSWIPNPIFRANYSDGERLYVGEYPLAYNSLYDIYNTPVDSLQAQADRMDPKLCKQYPTDGSRPGWGGAGYHVHDKQCKRYPASYLGPGLYWNTELCGPLP